MFAAAMFALSLPSFHSSYNLFLSLSLSLSHSFSLSQFLYAFFFSSVMFSFTHCDSRIRSLSHLCTYHLLVSIAFRPPSTVVNLKILFINNILSINIVYKFFSLLFLIGINNFNYIIF